MLMIKSILKKKKSKLITLQKLMVTGVYTHKYKLLFKREADVKETVWLSRTFRVHIKNNVFIV